MPNGVSGYYDDENGICWDDQYYDQDAKSYLEDLAERCKDDTPLLGPYLTKECVDEQILDDLANQANQLWEYVTGGSD